jgi:hypothetical protein
MLNCISQQHVWWSCTSFGIVYFFDKSKYKCVLWHPAWCLWSLCHVLLWKIYYCMFRWAMPSQKHVLPSSWQPCVYYMQQFSLPVDLHLVHELVDGTVCHFLTWIYDVGIYFKALEWIMCLDKCNILTWITYDFILVFTPLLHHRTSVLYPCFH